MQILTAASTQPDYVALAMVLILAAVVAIMALKKWMSGKQAKVTVAPIPETESPIAPGTAGEIKLHGVEPKTAAMLMAIVANKMGKPLNELRFISIKEVE